AHPSSARRRYGVPAWHAPRRVVPAAGFARVRARARASAERRAQALARGAAARLPPAPRAAAERGMRLEQSALLRPQWPAPSAVQALMTTRSAGDMASAEGRARLRALLPAEPAWLRQVHGTRVVEAAPGGELPEA